MTIGPVTVKMLPENGHKHDLFELRSGVEIAIQGPRFDAPDGKEWFWAVGPSLEGPGTVQGWVHLNHARLSGPECNS